MRLRNLTPLNMRCMASLQCPAVYEEDGGTHLRIIGKKIEPEELAPVISNEETIIRVERRLLYNIGGPISRRLMRLGL